MSAGLETAETDSPFDDYRLAACRLKRAADMLYSIDGEEQLEMVRDLAARQIDECRQALQIAVCALEAVK